MKELKTEKQNTIEEVDNLILPMQTGQLPTSNPSKYFSWP